MLHNSDSLWILIPIADYTSTTVVHWFQDLTCWAYNDCTPKNLIERSCNSSYCFLSIILIQCSFSSDLWHQGFLIPRFCFSFFQNIFYKPDWCFFFLKIPIDQHFNYLVQSICNQQQCNVKKWHWNVFVSPFQ